MISTADRALFGSCFSFVADCSPHFLDRFYQHVHVVKLEAGTSICDEGQQCSHLALLLEGVGRVYKLSPGGRELTLYRIQPGESCVLTASCIMSFDAFPAMARAETEMRALLVSPDLVRDGFCSDTGWQKFIFRLLSHRLAEIVTVLEEVAFKRIDVRIAEQLNRSLQQGNFQVHKTHAEIAADIGTSREVVSRILRDFSGRGLVFVKRGHIDILDAAAIGSLSQQ
jgi:CRP/FNR family transcriptional regulator